MGNTARWMFGWGGTLTVLLILSESDVGAPLAASFAGLILASAALLPQSPMNLAKTRDAIDHLLKSGVGGPTGAEGDGEAPEDAGGYQVALKDPTDPANSPIVSNLNTLYPPAWYEEAVNAYYNGRNLENAYLHGLGPEPGVDPTQWARTDTGEVDVPAEVSTGFTNFYDWLTQTATLAQQAFLEAIGPQPKEVNSGNP